MMGKYEVVHTNWKGQEMVTPLGHFGANDDVDAAANAVAQQAGGKVVSVTWVSY